MRTPVIITLSRFPDLFARFASSVESCGEDYPRLLVRDGDDPGFEPLVKGWTVISGREPFTHPGNLNLALAASVGWDVFYCNDDITLLDPKTVTKLQEVAYSESKIGILSPLVHGGVGNMVQTASQWKWASKPWVESQERLAFCSVYIKRSLMDGIGYLDERFTGYGGDDTDYCWRAREAGYVLAVTPLVHVKHGSPGSECSSSYSRVGRTGIAEMEQTLQDKWGQCGTRK